MVKLFIGLIILISKDQEFIQFLKPDVSEQSVKGQEL